MKAAIFLLAASLVTAGGWAGGGDAINTERGRGEGPDPQHHLALHPPTPLRRATLHTSDGNTDPQLDQDLGSVSSGDPQSSISREIFQSSSSGRNNVKHGGASLAAVNPLITAQRQQPYHLSELPRSSPPPQVPLWPDPPLSTPPAGVSPSLSPGPHSPLLSSHETHRETYLRPDFTLNENRQHRRMLQEDPRASRALRVPRDSRKHNQPLGFGGMPLNVRYLRTNIQVDRGKLSSRKRLRGLMEGRDGRTVGQAEAVSEDSEEYHQDDPQTFRAPEEKSEGVAELPPGKRNVTSQQSPEHSKETRHEKLTRDFPAQLTEQRESTEAISEELTDTKLRERGRENRGEITNTVNRGAESLAESANSFREPSLNNTTSNRSHKVNLDTLEMELSEKEEEASSDLLLAISILQHHLVPDTSSPRRVTHNSSWVSGPFSQALVDHSRFSDNSEHRRRFRLPPAAQETDKKFNIEIFDSLSSGSDEVVGEAEETVEESSVRHITHLQEEADLRERAGSRYRWFVLVLDGNCSVIKPRMTTFVTFLKAALSAKLSVDYNDVYVPSVFCDNTFMVNISLDTLKYPQVEARLRKLAEANTTLLEISEEIFYLEKILMKRSDEEEQNFQAIIKKPDDVELVIYIAVGCMCVFILLSVVIVMLIRVCRQEGDTLDLGKPRPHQIIPRSLDFPIRRPNVIYSHRFSQALIPGKCGRRGLEEGQVGGSSGVAVGGGSGRGTLLRYEPEVCGDGCVIGQVSVGGQEVGVGGQDVYTISALADDVYSDRRALVPSRRRTRHIPGEDVILEEEDLAEEEEEEEEEDDDEEEEEEEEEEERRGGRRSRRRAADLPDDEVLLEEDMDGEGETNQDHRAETLRAVSSSRSIARAALGPAEGRGGRGGGAGIAVDRGLCGSGGRGRSRALRGPSEVVVVSGIDNPCYTR